MRSLADFLRAQSGAAPPLELRDIHLPAEPSWWPPAPGWWLLAAILIGLLIWAVQALVRVRRARARLWSMRVQFEAALANTEARTRIAAISEMLRRAARLSNPEAAQLQGEAWLQFLDGDSGKAEFSQGPGRILLDGIYRPTLAASSVDALIEPARRRFKTLIEASR